MRVKNEKREERLDERSEVEPNRSHPLRSSVRLVALFVPSVTSPVVFSLRSACGSLPPLLASLHPPAEGRRERRSVVPPSLATRSPVVLRPPDRSAG